MKTTKKSLSGLVLLVLAGCSIGPSVKTFRPAQTPGGIQVALNVPGARLNGELLDVRASGLVLLAQSASGIAGPMNGVVLVPYERIRLGRFRQRSSLTIRMGRPPSEEQQARLRSLSRFPQGLDEAVLNRLLTAYGQTEIKVIP